MKQGLLINNESNIGYEIWAYLVDNPKAQDTFEGIVEWWLLERKIKFEKARVKEALSELVAIGLILEKKGSNSQRHYRINKHKYKEIQKAFQAEGRVIFIGWDIGMLEGPYANYSKTLHNAVEFVPDFGQYYPENDRAELYFRIITSPCYVKFF